MKAKKERRSSVEQTTGPIRNWAKVQQVTERVSRKGHVTVLGYASIHRVDNISLKPTFSVHIYGRDTGNAERHSYDPVTGEISRFVSGYCNVLRDRERFLLGSARRILFNEDREPSPESVRRMVYLGMN